MTRSGDRSALFVGVGTAVANDTLNRASHLEGQLGGHDDLHTATLTLHETAAAACGRATHFARLSAGSELVDGVRGGFHVGEFV